GRQGRCPPRPMRRDAEPALTSRRTDPRVGTTRTCSAPPQPRTRPKEATVSPQELSNLLWQERQLLDRLLFKLKVEQMLLAAGETRWLPMATTEAEEVLLATREVSLSRDVAA